MPYLSSYFKEERVSQLKSAYYNCPDLLTPSLVTGVIKITDMRNRNKTSNPSFWYWSLSSHTWRRAPLTFWKPHISAFNNF